MNTTKMTNKLILNLLIGGGLLAGLASCADESISLKDVNYPYTSAWIPPVTKVTNWFGRKNSIKTTSKFSLLELRRRLHAQRRGTRLSEG